MRPCVDMIVQLPPGIEGFELLFVEEMREAIFLAAKSDDRKILFPSGGSTHFSCQRPLFKRVSNTHKTGHICGHMALPTTVK